MGRELGVGMVAWSPLGGGFLSGKYARAGSGDPMDESLRMASSKNRVNDRNLAVLDVVNSVAKETGHSAAQVAIRWTMQKRDVASVVIGARTAAQLGLSLAAPILLFLATASVLPHCEPDEEWDMRRHYDRQRKVFILTFALYQVSTFVTAAIVGKKHWDYLAVIRVVIFGLLVSTLATNNRR